jgi:hypothetical protein
MSALGKGRGVVIGYRARAQAPAGWARLTTPGMEKIPGAPVHGWAYWRCPRSPLAHGTQSATAVTAAPPPALSAAGLPPWPCPNGQCVASSSRNRQARALRLTGSQGTLQ